MDLTEFLGEFQLEAGEKLDLMASELLKLERNTANSQPVRELFLAAHTIKGSAAMLGYDDLSHVGLELEQHFGDIVEKKAKLTPAILAAAEQCVEKVANMVERMYAERAALAHEATSAPEPEPAVFAQWQPVVLTRRLYQSFRELVTRSVMVEALEQP